MYLSSAVLVSFGLVSFTTAATAPERRVQVCNGHAEFCDRKYSNVSLIGTHDSAFVGSILDPRINQEKTVTQQLDAGIRFLQAQTHLRADDDNDNDNDSGIALCHTSCALKDAGPLETYLSTIKTWLDAHPDDVVTLLLTNGDGIDIARFGAAFHTTGLAAYAYTPPSSLPPPNPLRFLAHLTPPSSQTPPAASSSSTTSSSSPTPIPPPPPPPPPLPYRTSSLSEFLYFFETPYDTTDRPQVLPPNALSTAAPPKPPPPPEGRMYIVKSLF
ncbi:PLC-like phosphodiesterase [Lecanosticta acicola]|uniref:PLC-like phosphodiesterase n=1 Tax=Lecanosticta acicola TaxID=111012 RepID=A0AAI8Z023_9PEZI|nr:PLC-like phosphodiesterase [Lecanosticta acicola]